MTALRPIGAAAAEVVATLRVRPLRLREWTRKGDVITIRLTREPTAADNTALLAAAGAYVQSLADPGYPTALARTQLQASALLEAAKAHIAARDALADAPVTRLERDDPRFAAVGAAL